VGWQGCRETKTNKDQANEGVTRLHIL
jgi:hypothetical protein